MTIPEAQGFVGYWRRILIPWPAHTDVEAVRAMERSCLGVSVGPAFAIVLCSPSLPIWSWPLGYIVPILIVGILAFCLSLRFRAIRRLFDDTGAQFFSELRKVRDDKPSA